MSDNLNSNLMLVNRGCPHHLLNFSHHLGFNMGLDGLVRYG